MKTMTYICRLAIRPSGLMLLSALALATLEQIVSAGAHAANGLSFAIRFPELMKALTAAAVLTFAESVLMVVRLCTAPRVDVQEAPMHALFDRRAAATVYAVHQATWLVRLGAFLLLYGWL